MNKPWKLPPIITLSGSDFSVSVTNHNVYNQLINPNGKDYLNEYIKGYNEGLVRFAERYESGPFAKDVNRTVLNLQVGVYERDSFTGKSSKKWINFLYDYSVSINMKSFWDYGFYTACIIEVDRLILAYPNNFRNFSSPIISISIETIFKPTKYQIFLELLNKMEILDDAGNYLLHPKIGKLKNGKGYLVFAVLSGIKNYSNHLLNDNYTEEQLMSYFNTAYNCNWARIKKDSPGYRDHYKKVEEFLKRKV